MIEAREDVVPLDDVDEPERPSRETIDPERVGALADSIAAIGLLQKPGVRGPMPDGRYRLIYGHRRLLALRLLRWRELPCMVYPPDYDEDQARIEENENREPLNPIDQARECARLLEKGRPVPLIARIFKRSSAWVEGRLVLLHFPQDVQDAVRDEQISLGVASVLAQIDHDLVRADFLREAQRTGAKTSTAELWLYHYKADRERIVTNRLTVEAFVEQREAWVIKVPCQLCGQEYPYTETRSLRVDTECLAMLLQLVEQHAASADHDPS